MIISQARIMLSNESHADAIIPPVLVLDTDSDEVVDCIIEQGEIIARKDVWFSQCFILGEQPIILGELPPNPMPRVISCRIVGTKLPDAYYCMCYFGKE